MYLAFEIHALHDSFIIHVHSVHGHRYRHSLKSSYLFGTTYAPSSDGEGMHILRFMLGKKSMFNYSSTTIGMTYTKGIDAGKNYVYNEDYDEIKVKHDYESLAFSLLTSINFRLNFF